MPVGLGTSLAVTSMAGSFATLKFPSMRGTQGAAKGSKSPTASANKVWQDRNSAEKRQELLFLGFGGLRDQVLIRAINVCANMGPGSRNDNGHVCDRVGPLCAKNIS